MWRMDAKVCMDLLQEPELVSVGPQELGRKHDSCLQIFGRGLLEEGFVYSLILQNDCWGRSYGKASLTFSVGLISEPIRSGMVRLSCGKRHLKLWRRQGSLRYCGGSFHVEREDDLSSFFQI